MISMTCQQNQWPKSQYENSIARLVRFEAAKFACADFSGPIKTRSEIEQDWLALCVPAGNA